MAQYNKPPGGGVPIKGVESAINVARPADVKPTPTIPKSPAYGVAHDEISPLAIRLAESCGPNATLAALQSVLILLAWSHGMSAAEFRDGAQALADSADEIWDAFDRAVAAARAMREEAGR